MSDTQVRHRRRQRSLPPRAARQRRHRGRSLVDHQAAAPLRREDQVIRSSFQTCAPQGAAGFSPDLYPHRILPTLCKRDDDPGSFRPEGAGEFSQGWSEAKPLDRRPKHYTYIRPDQGRRNHLSGIPPPHPGRRETSCCTSPGIPSAFGGHHPWLHPRAPSGQAGL